MCKNKAEFTQLKIEAFKVCRVLWFAEMCTVVPKGKMARS